MRRPRLVSVAAGVLLPVALLAVGASSAAPHRSRGAEAEAKVIRQLVGSWQLASFTVRGADGALTYPYGKDAVGKLTYTRDGQQWATGGRRGAAKNLPDAFWYTGTFDVNPRRRTVVHHVQYSSIAAWEETDLVRSFKLRGNQLTLRVEPSTPGGPTSVLKWRRLSTPQASS